ncbi:MAG: sensor histidine kinase [Clostridia bacterium]|nr:sensor histidine kinase [Clostridia bacterium]
MNRDEFKKIIIVSMVTTLMGQVYINPFNSDFRLSIGIAIFVFLILKFYNISILLSTVVTALFVFTLRFSIDFIELNGTLNIGSIALRHLPSAVFYIVFGIALFQLNIRKYKEQPIFFIFLVGISDILSNIAEAAVRQEFTKTTIEMILTSLFIAGFLRATIAFILFSSIKAYNILILKEEHQKKYINLLLFTANMKAEVFFLQKTMKDIEQAMERCYSIYSELKDQNESMDKSYTSRLKERILNLSKDIHEIKKDNQRVVSGIERLLISEETENVMKLSSILKIFHDNTMRYIEHIGKEIKIFINYTTNLPIKDYYPLISILSNLINNSIDAITNSGSVMISQYIEDNYIIFKITDTGIGIKDEDIRVIFKPGFSTKFDRKTGRMSTGLGLTHVKHIVENHYGGRIDLVSKIGQGTRFFIHIPIDKIDAREAKL